MQRGTTRAPPVADRLRRLDRVIAAASGTNSTVRGYHLGAVLMILWDYAAGLVRSDRPHLAVAVLDAALHAVRAFEAARRRPVRLTAGQLDVAWAHWMRASLRPRLLDAWRRLMQVAQDPEDGGLRGWDIGRPAVYAFMTAFLLGLRAANTRGTVPAAEHF